LGKILYNFSFGLINYIIVGNRYSRSGSEDRKDNIDKKRTKFRMPTRKCKKVLNENKNNKKRDKRDKRRGLMWTKEGDWGKKRTKKD